MYSHGQTRKNGMYDNIINIRSRISAATNTHTHNTINSIFVAQIQDFRISIHSNVCTYIYSIVSANIVFRDLCGCFDVYVQSDDVHDLTPHTTTFHMILSVWLAANECVESLCKPLCWSLADTHANLYTPMTMVWCCVPVVWAFVVCALRIYTHTRVHDYDRYVSARSETNNTDI